MSNRQPADKLSRLELDRLEAVLAAGGMFLAGGVIPAPTLGAAVLIDAVEGHAGKTCLPAVARYILQNGRRAAPVVWAELRGKAGLLRDLAAEAAPITPTEEAELNFAFERVSAFRVLATGDDEPERMWDAEATSYVLREAARAVPGASARELMWELPLCMIGWLIVQQRRSDGERGLTRPELDDELWAKYMAESAGTK